MTSVESNGFVMLPIRILLATSLQPIARLTWAYLRHRQGENRTCWPSLERIACDLGIGKATCIRAIAELEKAGLLNVTRPETRGRGNHCRYAVSQSKKGPEADLLQKGKGIEMDLLKGSDMDLSVTGKVQTREGKGSNQNCNNNHRNKNQKYTLNSEAFRISQYLLSQIRQHKPDFREPNLQAWARHVDSMVRLDRRDPSRIRMVIEWCQMDSFWQAHVLSTSKLREKFDKLEILMSRNEKANYGAQRDFAGQRSAYGQTIEV